MDTPFILLSPYLNEITAFFKSWWWFFVPLILYLPVKRMYFWWINWRVWYPEQKWIMLELIPPGEIEKSSKTIEDLYNVLWGGVYDAPNWKGRWCEGEPAKYPYYFSLEIASIEGKVHFYLRIPEGLRKTVESVLYSHFPEIEIFEARDYTKDLPPELPNEEYDLLGEDFIFLKDYVYPIKTYKEFEGEKVEAVEPKKRIDPIHSLLENLVRIGKNEQVWFQIIAVPITNKEIPWVDRGRAEANKLMKRPAPESERSITQEVFRILFGKIEEKQEKPAQPISSETTLTPGEREILKAVEAKISKPGFKVNMRTIYVAKRDSFVPGHATIVRGYFPHFATQNLNSIIFWYKTRTKVNYFFKNRRLQKRKKEIYRKYIHRLPPLFPKMDGDGNMVMNTEELATIFHLPSKAEILPPGIPRVAAKKGGPPPGIPTE